LSLRRTVLCCGFFFQAEDGIRDGHVTGVQTCALPISALVRLTVPSVPATLSYLWVTIGFVISVSVGLFFGYYPANLAANLDPIRSEERRVGKGCRCWWWSAE